MSRIFISYSSADRPKVRQFVESMRALHLDLFFDQDALATDDRWTSAIRDELNAARVVVVFWTPNSAASEFVAEEATIAKSAGKLLSVQLSDCMYPLGFNTLSHIDFRSAASDFSDDAGNKLLKEIGERIGRPGLAEWARIRAFLLSNFNPVTTAEQLQIWLRKYPNDPANGDAQHMLGERQGEIDRAVQAHARRKATERSEAEEAEIRALRAERKKEEAEQIRAAREAAWVAKSFLQKAFAILRWPALATIVALIGCVAYVGSIRTPDISRVEELQALLADYERHTDFRLPSFLGCSDELVCNALHKPLENIITYFSEPDLVRDVAARAFLLRRDGYKAIERQALRRWEACSAWVVGDNVSMTSVGDPFCFVAAIQRRLNAEWCAEPNVEATAFFGGSDPPQGYRCEDSAGQYIGVYRNPNAANAGYINVAAEVSINRRLNEEELRLLLDVLVSPISIEGVRSLYQTGSSENFQMRYALTWMSAPDVGGRPTDLVVANSRCDVRLYSNEAKTTMAIYCMLDPGPPGGNWGDEFPEDTSKKIADLRQAYQGIAVATMAQNFGFVD